MADRAIYRNLEFGSRTRANLLFRPHTLFSPNLLFRSPGHFFLGLGRLRHKTLGQATDGRAVAERHKMTDTSAQEDLMAESKNSGGAPPPRDGAATALVDSNIPLNCCSRSRTVAIQAGQRMSD